MNTLQSLLELASTPEGKQKINNQVADACGVERMTAGWIPSYNDPDNIGCHPMAEPVDIPDYTSSLDAIMPEVRKLSSEKRGEHINHLCEVCKDAPDGPATAIEKAFFAEPVHHCIALLLTLQPTN